MFFIDGPGGSGKTHLYNVLIDTLESEGYVVLSFAPTGIAAAYLKKGKTFHSGFKLPFHIYEDSENLIAPASDEALFLKVTDVILIEEISMVHKEILRCIDTLMRQIPFVAYPDRNFSRFLFGGRIVVVGGDFRQILPVIPNGTKTEVIHNYVKNIFLWKLFEVHHLSTNMRSRGYNTFNKWLLDNGNKTTG
ncbi:hypothetical protein EIN_275290 [Entamoeba invadens IP1]|uniref:ATP-dependent DNA helicase n=1 Tax=Entamoeba invadens IP1 TaxID=370355 RepID=A0A0A1U1Q4_ENTIV|nr:hypothetical protein EIN_275290 [Entamoeba invadens IP1]ELP87942.1 hypothetical protein EIN_275290 [Entamoeba invadens IP1]|eukprot:XP_004254713.1 hypothetical protein EIN_275290 [Entamoeba invadens IP1]